MFLEALASYNGQLINHTEIGARIGVDRKTADCYLGLLEQLFIVQRLPAWSHSALKRLIKAPKLHFVAERTPQASQVVGRPLSVFALPRQRQRRSRHGDRRRVGTADRYRSQSIINRIGCGLRGAQPIEARKSTVRRPFLFYDGQHALPFGDSLSAVPMAQLWQH